MERLLALLAHHRITWPLAASDTCVRRVYAGHHQRSAGAWSWQLYATPDAQARGIRHWFNVGSQFTVKDLLKAGPDGTDTYQNPHGDLELCLRTPVKR